MGRRLSAAECVAGATYLLFFGSGTDLVRPSVADEAIRLTDLVATLKPQHPEAPALLALELFQPSRAATRLDSDGDLVLLEDQGRSRLSAAAITEGTRMLAAAEHTLQRLGAAAGPHLIQVQIAAEHATAATAEATDFTRIADLYARLSQVAPSPRSTSTALSPWRSYRARMLASPCSTPLTSTHALWSTTSFTPLAPTSCAVAAARRMIYRTTAEPSSSPPSDPEHRFLRRRVGDVPT